MKPKAYNSFINKVALGLTDLTDAQKANPRIIEDAWAARTQIKANADAEATKKAQAQAQSDQLPR